MLHWFYNTLWVPNRVMSGRRANGSQFARPGGAASRTLLRNMLSAKGRARPGGTTCLDSGPFSTPLADAWPKAVANFCPKTTGRTFAFAATLLCLVTLTTPAQADPKRDAADTLVKLDAVQVMVDRLISFDQIKAGLKARIDKLEPAQKTIVDRVITEEVTSARIKLEDAIARAAMRVYTIEEIRTLSDFLATPEGASIMTKTDHLARALMARIHPVTLKARQTIHERIREELN